MRTVLISAFVVVAMGCLICVRLEMFMEKQDPGICYALTFLKMPFLMGMEMTGAPVIFFAVLAVISVINWVLISRKPSSWKDLAFINAIADILAVLVLAERTGLPRCLGKFFGY